MDSQDVVLTREILEQGLSVNGAYNFDQLEVLGVEIPLKSGWRRRLIGKVVSSQAVEQFLAMKDAHLSTKTIADKQRLEMLSSKPQCRDCWYWELYAEDQGYCHRFPHRVTKDGDDWCGEFKQGENHDQT